MIDINRSRDLTDENMKEKIRHELVDTLNFSKVKLKPSLIIAVGFYKNKQFLIADANRNENFSDDFKYEYDINFRNDAYNNVNVLKQQPSTNYIYENCLHGN